MRVGVPREIKPDEYRVGLTPTAVREYVSRGHEVVVETSAGIGAGYPDEAYVRAGAKIVPDAAAVFEAAEQARVEAIGSLAMKGVAANLATGGRSSALCRASHKSRCTCILTQNPGDVPKASLNRRSMSALTAACPCRMRESITREIPRCRAKAETLIFSPSSHSVRFSPGCAGLCMSMVLSSAQASVPIEMLKPSSEVT